VNQLKDAAYEVAKTKNDQILKLQEVLDNSRLRVDELSKKLAETEKANMESKTRIKAVEPRCAELEKKLAATQLEMKEEIKRLLEEVSHLKANSAGTIAELQEQLAKLRAQVYVSNNEVAAVKDTLAEAEWNVNFTRNVLSEKDGRIEEVEKQLRASTLWQQELQVRHEELHAEVCKWESHTRLLEQQGMNKDFRITELEDELAQTCTQLDEGGNMSADVQVHCFRSQLTIISMF